MQPRSSRREGSPSTRARATRRAHPSASSTAPSPKSAHVPLLFAPSHRVESLVHSFQSKPSKSKVTVLLKRLIARLVYSRSYASSLEPRLAGPLSYALRLLSSRMYANERERDPLAIVEVLKKHVATDRARASPHSDALRLEEWCGKLLVRNALTKPWVVLYLLSSLSNDDSAQQRSLSTLPTLSSLFARRRQQGGEQTQAGKSSGAAGAASSGPASLADRAAQIRRAQVQRAIQANTSYDVSEASLLRDLIFCFQGIDGKYVQFSAEEDSYCVINSVGVPAPTRSLVRRISELGWMFRRVLTYITETLEAASVSLVEQSFCGALQEELTDYYRLVAVLESQLAQSEVSSRPEDRFSLRRMFVWVQDPLQRLQLMAMLTDAARGRKGGALLSAVAAYLQHGDSFVKTFTSRILRSCCRPVFEMIEQWVSVGELHDPYSEFFVQGSDAQIGRDRLWQDKYSLREAMLPSFIPASLANEILVTGKSINFARQACGESESLHVTATGKRFHMPDAATFEFDDPSYESLQAAVSNAAAAANKRLMRLMLEKFRLAEHCRALRKYLLLGQGDFARLLLDLLHPELNKGAENIFEHTLMNRVTAAVRGSNAQFDDPDIVDRINVRVMLKSDREVGWDVFSLDYKTDSPINVVFTEDSINTYLRVFNLLWSVKHVEHELTSSWTKHVHIRHEVRVMPEVAGVVHQGHLLRMEMAHFVSNLQSYLMFEVIECAWKELEDDMAAATNLDQLIAAHKRYLGAIATKALMTGDAATPDYALLHKLRTLFKIILKFTAAQNRMHSAITAEAQRREHVAARAAEQSAAGGYGLSGQDELDHDHESRAAPERIVQQFSAEQAALEQAFRDQLIDFLNTLAEPGHNANLQSLSDRIDYNEYYDDFADTTVFY